MQKLGDVVFTQDWVARSIVEHFNPKGTILEPCKGEGAFTKYLPTAEWCEISEGRDFFLWDKPVDWMIGNPPYSKAKFLPWIIHSFKYAENIVYLLPIKKVYNSFNLLRLIDEYGGIKEHFVVGPGHRIGFRYGFAFGAVHFQRGYKGGSVTTFTQPNKACTGLVGTVPLPSII